MELSCFGWTDEGGGGGGGGNISGGGTVNTLAMFTPIGTAIGDSMASQSALSPISPISVITGDNSFQIGRQNIIGGDINLAFGYDLQSYILGDMLFGTTIHVDSLATGNFNYWLGGNFNVFGACFQNIANLYSSTVTDSSYSILYGQSNNYNNVNYLSAHGHYSLFDTVSYSNIQGIFSSFTDVFTSNFIVTNSTILGGIDGRSGALGDSIIFNNNSTLSDYSYAFGYSLEVQNSNVHLIGRGLKSYFDNEIIVGHNNNTKFITRSDNFEFQISEDAVTNVPKNSEKLSGASISTTDAVVTTLQAISIPTDTILMIDCKITCRKTAGAGVGLVGDGNGYVRIVKAQNRAGVVTIGVIQSSFTSEVAAITSFNATFDVSGTDVRVRVNGAVNDDVNWNVITKQYNIQ